MKGFYIYVKNDLLEPKHYENMGKAVWLYLWLLDKMTSVNENGVGKVLGGRPIVYEEIKEGLGIPQRNYQRYVATLRQYGYINTIRTSRGFVITVTKANKVFGQKANDKNGTSHSNSKRQKVNSDTPKMSYQTTKMATLYRQDRTRQDNKVIKKRKDHRGEFSPAKEVLRKKWGKHV